jgi:hypothetical protein
MSKKYDSDPALFGQLTELVVEWGVPAILEGLAEIVTERNFRDPKHLDAIRSDRSAADELGRIADRCRTTHWY